MIVHSTLALVLAAPPAAGTPGRRTPPGGYWTAPESERAPRDGHTQIVVGGILFPLGTISALVSGVLTYYLTPPHCPSKWPSYSEQTCQGLLVFNAIHAGYGVLMMATGAVFLGIGLAHQRRHRAWSRERGLAVGPWAGPGGQAGATLGFRF